MSIENWRVSQESITGRWRAEHGSETVYADTNAKIHEAVEKIEALDRVHIHDTTD
jgi:hypothetical protein